MKKQGTEGQRDKGTKRRLFVFGPGIVMALVIGVFVIVKNYEDQKVLKPEKIMPSFKIGPETNKDQSLKLNMLFLLSLYTDELNLKTTQKKSIHKLYKEFGKDTKSLQTALDAASKEFSSYMNSQKGKNTSINDIQEHSQEVQRLSRELSEVRRFYWNQAMNLLAETQKKHFNSIPIRIEPDLKKYDVKNIHVPTAYTITIKAGDTKKYESTTKLEGEVIR